MRIGGVEAVDVRERHAQVGRNQAAHERRQRVVVAELNLVDGDGVVFVDDRHHTQFHQAQQGVARVQVGRTARRVMAREQHERGEQVTRMELLVVGRRDDALTGQATDKRAVDLAIGTHHRGRADLYHHRFIGSRHTSNQSSVEQEGELEQPGHPVQDGRK